MGNTGKIARLPAQMRTAVNEAIEAGLPARKILQWLNKDETVCGLLDEYFEGIPISVQNLSEWKARGYQDWLKHKETRALAREFLAEAGELQDEVDTPSFCDRLSSTVALTLARMLRDTLVGAGKDPNVSNDPAQRAAVLQIVREISRLRHADHRAGIVQIARERWEADCDETKNLRIQREKSKAVAENLWSDIARLSLASMGTSVSVPKESPEIRVNPAKSK